MPLRSAKPAATWVPGQARSTKAAGMEAAARSSDEPAACTGTPAVGMAAACTEAALAAENTWVARQERSPPDGLVHCMKLRACWLASPD